MLLHALALLQEAEAIFGDVDDLLAMYEDRKHARAAAADDEEGLDDEEEDEGLDDEEAEARRLARVRLGGCCVAVMFCAAGGFV